MGFKARHKFLKYPGIDFKNHMFTGTEWPYIGKNGEEYFVVLQDKGFTCTCPGLVYHGKCRHIRQTAEALLGN